MGDGNRDPADRVFKSVFDFLVSPLETFGRAANITTQLGNSNGSLELGFDFGIGFGDGHAVFDGAFVYHWRTK